jgi:hypothetical protein
MAYASLSHVHIMSRHPLAFLPWGLAALALSFVTGGPADGETWRAFCHFALALVGCGCLLAGFLSSAFLAGGRKVVWPLIVHAVTIVMTLAAFLGWAVFVRPR